MQGNPPPAARVGHVAGNLGELLVGRRPGNLEAGPACGAGRLGSAGDDLDAGEHGAEVGPHAQLVHRLEPHGEAHAGLEDQGVGRLVDEPTGDFEQALVTGQVERLHRAAVQHVGPTATEDVELRVGPSVGGDSDSPTG